MKKVYKPLLLCLFLILATLSGLLGTVLWNFKTDFDVFLDATDFKESEESKQFNGGLKQKNNYENSFLGYGSDNYSFYNYKYGEWDLIPTDERDNEGDKKFIPAEQKFETIEDADFSGKVSTYDNVTNDAMTVNLWNNDFSVVNLIIKTKDDFVKDDRIFVDVKCEDSSLSIDQGFLRNIVANASRVSKNWYVQNGVTKDLIVPDGITTNKSINMVKDKVYIYRIRINRDELSKSGISKIDICVNTRRGDKLISEDQKQIIVRKINKSLDETIKTSPKDEQYNEPTYNVLDYPNNMAYFYNNFGLNKNDINYFYHYDKRIRTAKGNIPPALSNPKFDENNMIEYVDWNWKHYWKNEFEYQAKKLGSGSFFNVSFSRDGNHPDGWEISGNKSHDEYTKSNLWNDDRNGNAYFMWRIKDSNGFYINENDWMATDDYIYKMGQLGYRKIILNDLLQMNYYSINFFEWNNKEQKWVLNSYLADPKDRKEKIDVFGNKLPSGYETNKQILKQWTKHIEYLENNNSSYNWVKSFPDMISYFYLDECDNQDVKAFTDIIREIEQEDSNSWIKDFLKLYVAYPVRFMNDRNGNWTEMIKDVDALYLYTSSLYINGNKRVQDLLNYRNKKKLLTGMYQLNSSGNNDMLRSDPGVLVYEMLLLNKQNEPNYMKYNIARWNNCDNYWSGSYWEPEFYEFPYTSGDNIWEYSAISSVDESGVKKSYEQLKKEFEFYWENEEKLPIITSTRLESLALGVNLVRKVKILQEESKINIKDVNRLMTESLTNSRKQSKNRFNFDSNKLGIKVKQNYMGISYIDSFLKFENMNYGQIDAVKMIEKMIDFASLNTYGIGENR